MGRCAIHPAFLPVVSDTVAIVLAVPIALTAFRCFLPVQLTSWPFVSTRHVRFAVDVVPITCRAFLDAPDTAWYDHFVARVV
jgi:hypothetical protein